MNLKFWEWFKKRQETKPNLDPTEANVLKEYQDAIGIQRIPMQNIDRYDLTTGEITNPSIEDNAETLKRKLQHGIHQSVMSGADTHTVSGVRAISMGGTVEVISKIDKSKLYELGYDIREENESFVKNLGLVPEKTTETETETVTESEIPLPKGADTDTPEEKRLELEGIQIAHYSGKPQDRPWYMQLASPCAFNPETGNSEPTESYPTAMAELVVPKMEAEIALRI